MKRMGAMATTLCLLLLVSVLPCASMMSVPADSHAPEHSEIPGCCEGDSHHDDPAVGCEAGCLVSEQASAFVSFTDVLEHAAPSIEPASDAARPRAHRIRRSRTRRSEVVHSPPLFVLHEVFLN